MNGIAMQCATGIRGGFTLNKCEILGQTTDLAGSELFYVSTGGVWRGFGNNDPSLSLSPPCLVSGAAALLSVGGEGGGNLLSLMVDR